MKLKTRVRVNENGRVVIPASFRKQVGIRIGDEVILQVENDELLILTLKGNIERAQQFVRKHVKPGTSLVDELIADRAGRFRPAIRNPEAKGTPELLREAVISTVNLAEVHGKPCPVREAVAFTAEHDRAAGELVVQGRGLGLSLGDRACLALGVALQAPVYTAARSWKKLKVNGRIHAIR
jgi:AbrB family looped-hinge helix DNA binding protein